MVQTGGLGGGGYGGRQNVDAQGLQTPDVVVVDSGRDGGDGGSGILLSDIQHKYLKKSYGTTSFARKYTVRI